MVSFLTRLFVSFIVITQIVFSIEVISAVYEINVPYISSINYAVGIETLLILIARLFTAFIHSNVKYVSLLMAIPIVNVFTITYLTYKLTLSRLLSLLTFVIWFSSLIVTLLFKLPIYQFASVAYYLPYLVALDLTSLASLLVVTYAIFKFERTKK